MRELARDRHGDPYRVQYDQPGLNYIYLHKPTKADLDAAAAVLAKFTWDGVKDGGGKGKGSDDGGCCAAAWGQKASGWRDEREEESKCKRGGGNYVLGKIFCTQHAKILCARLLEKGILLEGKPREMTDLIIKKGIRLAKMKNRATIIKKQLEVIG